MLKAIFNWFTGKPAPQAEAPRVPETVAPYKVETPAPVAPVATAAPAPAQCGCGRSPTGLCVGLHKLTAEEWATHADNPAKAAKAKAPAKPRGAAKPKAEKKPATPAIKAPAKPKAPRKPRAAK